MNWRAFPSVYTGEGAVSVATRISQGIKISPVAQPGAVCPALFCHLSWSWPHFTQTERAATDAECKARQQPWMCNSVLHLTNGTSVNNLLIKLTVVTSHMLILRSAFIPFAWKFCLMLHSCVGVKTFYKKPPKFRTFKNILRAESLSCCKMTPQTFGEFTDQRDEECLK